MSTMPKPRRTNGIFAWCLAAAALASVGVALLTWGRVERRLADAAEQLAAGRAVAAASSLDSARSSLGALGSLAPFDALAAAVATRRAELAYWQGDYAAIVPAGPEPLSALPEATPALRAIVANAVFRQARGEARTPADRIAAIDRGIAAQLAVLRAAPWHTEAAYNYEFLVRLKAAELDEPTLGAPNDNEGTEKSMFGQPGGAPRKSDPANFNIHIPLESKEFENERDGERAGKAAARERRG